MTSTGPKLNRSIFLGRISYFLFFAAASALLPFLVLYYEQLGLSGRQIGLLAGVMPLITLISSSLWGGLADATRQHKQLLAVAVVGNIVFALLIYLANSFWTLVPLVALYAFFMGPIMPLIDHTVLEALNDDSSRYGKVRLWGSLGWGVAAPLAGQLVERFGLGWAFYSSALLGFLGLIGVLRLPVSRASLASGFGQGLRTLLSDVRWPLFLLLVFLGGMGHSTVHNYWFLYLKRLGTGETVMGLSLTIATVSELIFFFYSDSLLKRFGPRKLLVVAVISQGGRLLIYSIVTQPAVAIFFQLLHGPSFALMWAASVSYAGQIAPKGLGATAQGLLSSVCFGLAMATGAFLGGFLYEQAGIFLMYRWVAIVLFASLLIFAAAGPTINKALMRKMARAKI